MKPPLNIIENEITYVLRCGDYVKIGHSAFLDTRLQQFRPGNPLEITVLITFPLGELYERYLHKKFIAHWHRDEWYRIEGAVADWIRRGFPHKKEIASLLKRHRLHQKGYAELREVAEAKKAALTEQQRLAQELARKQRASDRLDFWRRKNLPVTSALKVTM